MDTETYFVFSNMHCLHRLTQLCQNSSGEQFSSRYLEHLKIVDSTNTLISYWGINYKHAFIQTWDLLTGKPKQNRDLSTHEFGIGKKGQVIVVTYQDLLWTLCTETLEKTENENIGFFTSTHGAFAISPGRQPLVAAGHTTRYEGELEIRNYETNDRQLYYAFSGISLINPWEVRRYETDNSPASRWVHNCSPLLFTPDSKTLISHFLRGRNESVLKVWDVSSGELLHTLTRSPALTIMELAVDPFGKLIACGLRDDRVSVWEVLSDHVIHTTADFSPCALSSDGCLLAYSTTNYEIITQDLVTNEVHNLTGHTAMIDAITISSNHRFIASHSTDGTIMIWSAAEHLSSSTS